MGKARHVLVVSGPGIPGDVGRVMRETAARLGLGIGFCAFGNHADAWDCDVVVCLSGGGDDFAAELADELAQPVLVVPVAVAGDDPLEVLRGRVGRAGCLALGEAGARNAVILAASIIGLREESVRLRLDEYRRQQTESVLGMPLPGGGGAAERA